MGSGGNFGKEFEIPVAVAATVAMLTAVNNNCTEHSWHFRSCSNASSLLSLQSPDKLGSVITPVVQVRKWAPRRAGNSPQLGGEGGKSLGSLAPECKPLASTRCPRSQQLVLPH